MDKLIIIKLTEDIYNPSVRGDKFLSEQAGISRTKIKKLFEEGKITSDNKIDLDKPLILGSEIRIINDEIIPNHIIAAKEITFKILFEDEYLLVIDKPAGITTHPGAGQYYETLVNQLVAYTKNLSQVNGEFRPGIVHRLDKETSGVMLVAKNDEIHNILAHRIAEKEVKRIYSAITYGRNIRKTGRIETNIVRCRRNREKMVNSIDEGKLAITNYQITENLKNNINLVKCELETGRTHQIRVHMLHINNHVIGDKKYGPIKRLPNTDDIIWRKILNFERQALHSHEISFEHPITNNPMHYISPLPEDLEKFIASS